METTADTYRPTVNVRREWSGLPNPGYVARDLSGKMIFNATSDYAVRAMIDAEGYKIGSFDGDDSDLYGL